MDDRGIADDAVDSTRPDGPGARPHRAAEWLEWFGVARLVTSAVAVVAVCAGAWFLVRSPTPPTEAGLPVATTDAAASTTSSTEPPPSASSSTRTEGGSGEDDAERLLVVHVTGAVRRPGVYAVPAGSRVADVIERALGATAVGRPHEMNLALPVVDGMRIAVPVEGEEVDPALRVEVPPDLDVAAGVAAGPIDVNVADVRALDELPGVGPATAAAIVAEREQHGPFASVDDLLRVPGIGPAKLERLRGSVTT